MKLSQNILTQNNLSSDYTYPKFDVLKMREKTKDAPKWLHFGAGNIFRAYPACLMQDLLDKGVEETGIICCEGYDGEIIDKAFLPYDNLSIAATLCADGKVKKQIVASVSDSFYVNLEKLKEIFIKPSLQMISFTVTEKAYKPSEEDMKNSPENAQSFWGMLAYLCLFRIKSCKKPLAFVSMDNCSENGRVLKFAVKSFFDAWKSRGEILADEYDFFCKNISFPWTTIDKITPRPGEEVKNELKNDGFEGLDIIVTGKNSYTAGFVNAEEAQYLVIEDNFPNGRPCLENAGVIFTDRENVNAFESMKVGTCLNPLHTALSVFGILLGYTDIAQEMKDKELVSFINKMVEKESMPVAVVPKIIDPKVFLNEVVTKRFVNPFLKDSPQRIATDTSLKLPIRFGQSLKKQAQNGTLVKDFDYIPLVFAAWIRYLLEIDDSGTAYTCSPDPKISELMPLVKSIGFKNKADKDTLSFILKRDDIWGVDLYKLGLDEKILSLFNKLNEKEGSLRQELLRLAALN